MDYPKYQYSVFLGGREEQLVIRADSWEEFLTLKKNADSIIEKKQVKPESPQRSLMDDDPEEIISRFDLTDMLAKQVREGCTRCKGPNVYNPKTGKVFCRSKCWLKG